MDWPNSKRIPQHCGLNTRKLFIYSKHSWPTTDCFHSRGQQLNKFLGTNVKFLHQTKVQATKDFFGTPTWPPFHCFVHQYGRRNVIWKRSTFKFVLSEFWTIQRRRRIPPIRAQFTYHFHIVCQQNPLNNDTHTQSTLHRKILHLRRNSVHSSRPSCSSAEVD